MLDQQINEQLGLLQKELLRLKTVTDYIDGTKENSISIIAELEKVQQNYAIYTNNIFNLYKQYIDDLKKNTEIQINEGVLKIETTGNKIATKNNEKLVETKRLLEQYKKIAEATDNLVTTLEAVDFPTRLTTIDTNIQALNKVLNEAQQSIEKKQSDSQELLQQLNHQNKEIKLIKTVLFVICGLIVIGTVATILVLK